MKGLLCVVVVASLWAAQGYRPEKILSRPGYGGLVGGVASIYDSATSVWTFNDPSDLGNDSVGSNDLTLVNTPTATGGALGDTADFENGSAQYAAIAHDASLTAGSGISFGAVWWVVFESVGASRAFGGKGSSSSLSTMEWFAQITAGDGGLFRVTDGSTTASCTIADSTFVAGVRYMVAFWYDQTDDKVHCNLNAGTVQLSSALSGGDVQSVSGQDWQLGRKPPTFDPMDGVMDSVAWYRLSGNLDLETQVTSLYNSSKGKECADLSVADQVDLVSFWDMDEDGGPYVDCIGSNDLTAFNTPTQAAGLVERSDSGMATVLASASSQEYTLADPFFMGTNLSICWWQNLSSVAANQIVASKWEHGNNTEWAIENTTGGDVRVYIAETANSGGTFHGETATTITLNQWENYCFVYDGDGADDAARLKIYRDGSSVTVTVTNSIASSLTNGVSAFHVGSFSGSLSRFMNGAIDNLAVWPTSLSADNVSTLWDSGAGFFAAYWDAIFNGPRFAWSQPPQLKRIES